MVEIDVRHSNLYPYAIRIARELGAKMILIEPKFGNILEPDVLGIRDSENVKSLTSYYLSVNAPKENVPRPLVIVQCEISTGPKTQKDAFKKHSRAAEFADFVYILDGDADKPFVRRNISESMPEAKLFSLDEPKKRYGDLDIETNTK